MKKQQQFVLWILLLSTIEVIGRPVTRRPINRKVSQTNIPCQCPQVDHDEDVLTSADFTIQINPENSRSKSYSLTDKNGYITILKIINEENPIPSSIFALTQLKQLEIRNTCFFPCEESKIPSEIQCLAFSLTELGIYDTKITQLPNEITRLVRLKTLKLSNTGLVFLPDAIGNLRSLASLYLPYNDLKHLPTTIRKLQFLQELTVSNNPNLQSIESINGLPSLISLDTRNCPIDVLPRNLPKLINLYMSNNSLTNLNAIGTLGTDIYAPKSFFFDENFIQSIPHGIGEVENLRSLKLDQNQLTSLPKDIFNIPTLTHLNIKYNQFSSSDLDGFALKFHQTNPNLELLY